MRKRQAILTGLLCSLVVGAACYRIMQQPEVLPPPYKIIKIVQRHTYPVLPKVIFQRTVGIEFDKELVGAGVLLRTGQVLTAAHVLEGQIDRYMVQLKALNGMTLASEFKIDKIDRELDLALLSCFTDKIEAIGVAGNAAIGTAVVMSGSPAGYKPCLLSGLGHISRKEKDFWICSSTIYGGFSGGGAWDVNTGLLVGIVQGQVFFYTRCGSRQPVPGTAIIIPAPIIKEFLDKPYPDKR